MSDGDEAVDYVAHGGSISPGRLGRRDPSASELTCQRSLSSAALSRLGHLVVMLPRSTVSAFKSVRGLSTQFVMLISFLYA
jgi:hypothetical protein